MLGVPIAWPQSSVTAGVESGAVVVVVGAIVVVVVVAVDAGRLESDEPEEHAERTATAHIENAAARTRVVPPPDGFRSIDRAVTLRA